MLFKQYRINRLKVKIGGLETSVDMYQQCMKGKFSKEMFDELHASATKLRESLEKLSILEASK